GRAREDRAAAGAAPRLRRLVRGHRGQRAAGSRHRRAGRGGARSGGHGRPRPPRPPAVDPRQRGRGHRAPRSLLGPGGPPALGRVRRLRVATGSRPAPMDEAERNRQVRRVLLGVLVLNLVVFAAKLAYGLWSGSLAISSDAVHSMTDAGANVIGIVVLRLAAAPPDAGHPYGHRKLET